jgi:hypothetical protein
MNSDVGIITKDTPLRLEMAAKLAFPDGSMKLAGLRREIARGRLDYEVIAGKHYTTLADIDAMRKLCRVQAKGRTSAGGQPDTKTANFTKNPSGSSETESPKSPQDVLRVRLSRKLQSQRKQL